MMSRWTPPAGCIIAARYLHSAYVLHLNAVHRIDCQLLKLVPVARMRACNLAAIPSGVHACPRCIAPSQPRRDPARVEPPTSSTTSGAGSSTAGRSGGSSSASTNRTRPDGAGRGGDGPRRV